MEAANFCCPIGRTITCHLSNGPQRKPLRTKTSPLMTPKPRRKPISRPQSPPRNRPKLRPPPSRNGRNGGGLSSSVTSRFDRAKPTSSHAAETDAEVPEFALLRANHRKAAMFSLHTTQVGPGNPRQETIDSEALSAALRRNAATEETHAQRPRMSFTQRQAHRARKKTLLETAKTKMS